MLTYIIRRLFTGLIILLLVTVIVFLLVRLLPGDPLLLYMSSGGLQGLDDEALNALKAQYGLDKPLIVQYFNWLGNLAQGDLGTSIIMQEKINKLIAHSLPITMHLGIIALILGNVLGITAGALCALKRGTWIDTVVTLFANLGITIPAFWLGIILIYIFCLKLHWLPVSGYTSPMKNFWISTRQIILPVIVLSANSMAGLCRQTRSAMLEVVHQDYIRTARAKGLGELMIVMRHELKNSLIPVVTILGMEVGVVFGGAVIVETIFNIPGMGRLMVNGVFQKDYQIVQASVLMMGAIVILSNLIVDISYGWFDPRIRYD